MTSVNCALAFGVSAKPKSRNNPKPIAAGPENLHFSNKMVRSLTVDRVVTGFFVVGFMI